MTVPEEPANGPGHLEQYPHDGCVQVEDAGNRMPFCVLAERTAVARKAALDEIAAFARDGASNPKLVEVALRNIARVCAESSDSDVSVVADIELLPAIVEALALHTEAEPSVYTQWAVSVRDTLARDGWLVVERVWLESPQEPAGE